MTRRDALFLLATVALLALVVSGAVHLAIAPICLAWLAVQRFVIERSGIRLPDVALALLHAWLGVVFLAFAFLGERGSNGRMDMLELMLAFAGPFLLLKLAAPPSRFNDALAVLTGLVLALGSAATAPGYRPLVILVAFLATLCWVLPVLVQREPDGGSGPRVRVVGDAQPWASVPHVAAGALTVIGLFGGLLLYVLVPRLGPSPDEREARSELGIANRGAAKRETRSGFAKTMRLGDIGRIKRDERLAFEAQLSYYGRPYDPPYSRREMLLLRARAWDRYDPETGEWSRALGRGRPIGSGGLIEAGATPVDWRLKMHGYDGRTLFLPQRTRRVRSEGVGLRLGPAGSVVADRELRAYGVEAADPITSRVDLRRLVADPSRPSHLEVPPALLACLRRLLPRHDGLPVADRIGLVHQVFTQGGFRYTLELPASLPDEMDPIEAFVERREGHCELFASTACLLLRLMGVPARIVGGIRLADRVGEGRYLARYRNAHAWVEVPFHQVGYVAFDFTPPDRSAVTPSDRLSAGNERDAALDIDERRRKGTQGGEKATFDWGDPFRFTREDQARMRRRVGRVLTALPYREMLGAALLAVLLLLARRGWRRRGRSPLRVRPPPGVAPRVFAFYVRWLKRCAAKGHRRRASQTPREFLATLPPELREEGTEITGRFEALRYGS